MALTNPISITYGSREVGGSSDTYQIDGPYQIDKSHGTLRLTMTVLVVASTTSGLQSASEALEDDFRKRDQDLVVSMGGDSWTYTFGENILNTRASCAKSGNRETDRGVSRAYIVSIEGELPADDTDGLRDLEVHVDYEPGRRKIVSMRGTYTALDATLASAQYVAEFDAKASTILTAVDNGATWELVDEQYTHDRNNHGAAFSRQYVELLADQSQGGRDDADIRDHSVTFAERRQHPGDGIEDTYRLRRLDASYACSINIDETTDLQTVWANKVRPHLLSVFEQDFSPIVFAVESSSVTYDESAKRLSAVLSIIYQPEGGSNVVEVEQSVTISESRQIDYTPVHNGAEFAAEADAGWATRERLWTRSVVVIGNEAPRRRIGELSGHGSAGQIETQASQVGVDITNTGRVQQDGWNVVSNKSSVTSKWLGDPEHGQFLVTMLSEQVVERWHVRPTGSAQGPGTGGS